MKAKGGCSRKKPELRGGRRGYIIVYAPIRGEYDKNTLYTCITIVKIFLKEVDLPIRVAINGYSKDAVHTHTSIKFKHYKHTENGGEQLRKMPDVHHCPPTHMQTHAPHIYLNVSATVQI